MKQLSPPAVSAEAESPRMDERVNLEDLQNLLRLLLIRQRSLEPASAEDQLERDDLDDLDDLDEDEGGISGRLRRRKQMLVANRLIPLEEARP